MAHFVSPMARVSARPIRPPGRGTLKRMSDIIEPPIIPRGIAGAGCSGNRSGLFQAILRLYAVIALDNDEIPLGMRAADPDQPGVFRRIVASERGLVILESQYPIARPRRTFLGVECPAAPQKLRAVFPKHRSVLRDVFLIAVHVVNVDARDPIAFGHLLLPVLVIQPLLFSLCYSALRLRDFGHDGVCARLRIGRADDWACSHQETRPARDRAAP